MIFPIIAPNIPDTEYNIPNAFPYPILFSNIIDKQASTITANFNVPLSFTAETNKIGGSSPSKHLTIPITLGAPAVGIKVLIQANRPRETDFELYFRTASEDQLIRDKDFTLVSPETAIPSDENDQIFRQYQYLIGGQGGDLIEFIRFQLKIVFRNYEKNNYFISFAYILFF